MLREAMPITAMKPTIEAIENVPPERTTAATAPTSAMGTLISTWSVSAWSRKCP